MVDQGVNKLEGRSKLRMQSTIYAMTPIRGLSIDPSRPLEQQKISTSIQLPYSWLLILGDVARNAGVSKSKVINEAFKLFCEEHKIELPPLV